MDPRVHEVIEILQAQVTSIQDNSRVVNRNAVKPIESLSTEDLALSVNLSETRLRALFKADTGVTPNQYLKRIRMEKAALIVVSATNPLSTERCLSER